MIPSLSSCKHFTATSLLHGLSHVFCVYNVPYDRSSSFHIRTCSINALLFQSSLC